MLYLHMWKDFKTLEVQSWHQLREGREIGYLLQVADVWTFMTVGRMSFCWESQGRWRNWLNQVHYPFNLSEKLCSNSAVTFGYFHQKSTNIYKCWWTVHFNYMFNDLTPPSCLFKAKGWQGWIILMSSFLSLRKTLDILSASS